MRSITVIGGGYVGLITAACFTRLGHRVVVVENDGARLAALRAGKLPVHEPGLPEIWEQGVEAGLLTVTSSYREAVRESDFVFVAVGTPARANGSVDLRQVVSAVRSVVNAAKGALPVIILKSTVPPGTAELVREIALEQHPWDDVTVVSNPEFLREGLAVIDFMRPSRVVIGGSDRDAMEAVGALYEKLRRPVIYTTSRSAEMIKYASNAFLATKISFINEIAALCEEIGVDVTDISKAIGMDPRIGPSYLDAGIGWGGSCLPKDLSGLIWTANRVGVQMPVLTSVQKINNRQTWLVVSRLQSMLGDPDGQGLRGKTIAVWGLAFKPNCDDIRESPALHLMRNLEAEGCRLRAFDPVATDAAARHYPEVVYCADAYEAAHGADAVVLATAWPQFQSLDLAHVASAMRRSFLVDARNALDPQVVSDAGLVYAGIGRGVSDEPSELGHLRENRGRKPAANGTGRRAA
jgi:UDPglucose 6-dehydrogenase